MKFDFSNAPTQFQAAITDMGFLWRLCPPTTEGWELKLINGEVLTWDNYAWSIFTEALKIHKDTQEIHFVNDR